MSDFRTCFHLLMRKGIKNRVTEKNYTFSQNFSRNKCPIGHSLCMRSQLRLFSRLFPPLKGGRSWRGESDSIKTATPNKHPLQTIFPIRLLYDQIFDPLLTITFVMLYTRCRVQHKIDTCESHKREHCLRVHPTPSWSCFLTLLI